MPMNWSDNPAFRNMDPRKMELLNNLAAAGKGKSTEQMVPLIMQTMDQLKRENIAFTREESQMMMDILSEDLPPKDKARFQMVKNMMGWS
ncbi:hypothetical protein [Anaerolentibacter hominis]|uniref:hypothetical protein n=1 Tax=Anaerolentibacter hominis TaxID=3079009 RepID=UPI0031B8B03E